MTDRSSVQTSPGVQTFLNMQVWPVYRVLDDDGSVRADSEEPDLSQELALKIYGNMIRLEAMDDIFYNAQRQVQYLKRASCLPPGVSQRVRHGGGRSGGRSDVCRLLRW